MKWVYRCGVLVLWCLGLQVAPLVAAAEPMAAKPAAGQQANRQASDAGLAALDRGHYATAMRAWRAAAEQGDAFAMTNIGYLHEHGLGVPQNYVEAMVWYRQAAAAGSAQARFNLGTLYYYGYGVERNPREALSWFRQAARQQLPDAQYMVGLAYHEGQGVVVDAGQALTHFLAAAKQGYAPAQMMAGMVLLAAGGRNDLIQAYVWAQLAAEHNQSEAALVRDYASYRLKPADVEHAKHKVENCHRLGLAVCMGP